MSEQQRDWMIEFLTKIKPKICLEIGFAGGRHTSTLLHTCNVEKIISIDINFNYHNGRSYCDNFLDKFKNIQFIEGDSKILLTPEFFKNAFPNGLDYVFIDGGHDYATAMSDMQMCFPYLNSGAVMVVDDYCSSGPVGCNIPELDKAVQDFSKVIDTKFETIHLTDGKGMAVFIK